MELDDELDAVRTAWTFDPDFAASTVERMSAVLVRFVRYVDAHGYTSLCGLDTDVCHRFVHAPTRSGQPPAAQTMHFRRTTIRTTLRTLRLLGVDAADPTLDIELPARGGVQLRALTDAEIERGRIAAFVDGARDVKRPTAWALAETTGTTADLTTIGAGDVAVSDDGAVTVGFPASRTAAARTVAATGWAATVLRRRLDEVPADGPLCYDGRNPPGSGAAQAATCGMLGTILRVTGLSRDPAVRPGSIRLWRIRREFDETGSLEHAARIAGARSLDTLAHQLDHHWTKS